MKKIIVILLLISICNLIFSNNEDIPDPENADKLNHFEVTIGPWISAGLLGASFIENTIFDYTPPDAAEYYIERLTIAGAQVPAVFSSPVEGGVLFLLTASQWLFLEFTTGIYTALFNYFVQSHPGHLSMYGTYTAYRENRLKAGTDCYNRDWRVDSLINRGLSAWDILESFRRPTNWKDYSFLDLSLETLNPKNFLDPMVLPIALAFVVPMVTNPHYYTFWEQERAFIGSLELTPLLAVPLMGFFLLLESVFIAVTEESHFRGFLYEELASLFGAGVAKVLDTIYFPLIHIRSDFIKPDFNIKNTISGYLEKATLTLYLDFLYDRGGLPLCTAAHMWIDFTYFFTQWLLVSGIPHESLSGTLNIEPSLCVEFYIPL